MLKRKLFIEAIQATRYIQEGIGDKTC